MASATPAGGEGPGEPTIRVALADDSLLMREALDNLLGAADGVEVVASCADRDSLRPPPQTSPATLAAPLQRAQATQLTRRPAPAQPR
jgi:DNA-binding NarL/FixJ family response regulator